MAVPFNIPADQNEVEVIINQLQLLLTRLQAAVRRYRGLNPQNPSTSQAPTTSRVSVHSGASSRVRTRDEEVQTTLGMSSVFPDLFNNLAWLAVARQDIAFSSSQLTANSITRSSRGRTTSESSCCEETKISITATVNHGTAQNWNQDEGSNEPESASGEGILSKLVPSRVSAPLWTAMICIVGWHLFRAR